MSVQEETPKSRITLTYKTEVDGEPAVVDLPLRLLVTGDLSLGSSKDRAVDLDERALRSVSGSNTSEMMRDMGISLDMVVPNKTNPDEESMRVNLDIDDMSSFSPEAVAKQIPQVRSLLLFKRLLEEIGSNVANKKELASLLNKLFANPEALKKVKEQLKEYQQYHIPEQTTQEVANVE